MKSSKIAEIQFDGYKLTPSSLLEDIEWLSVEDQTPPFQVMVDWFRMIFGDLFEGGHVGSKKRFMMRALKEIRARLVGKRGSGVDWSLDEALNFFCQLVVLWRKRFLKRSYTFTGPIRLVRLMEHRILTELAEEKSD